MTPQTNQGEELPDDWFVLYANILRYATSLNWDFPKPGTLDFVPAGKQDSSYATRVNGFNWRRFYDHFGGHQFIEAAKERMKADYDYILIDSNRWC
jgi:cellulose biosynthesis protein BcsQ